MSEREIVEKLRQTTKYADLSEETLAWAASWALKRVKAPKEALKAAKKKLHQVYGAYIVPGQLKTLRAALQRETSSPDDLQDVCRDVMSMHVSTKERLAIMENLYADIMARTGAVSSVLDVACGYNPFAIPWMGLPQGCTYTGMEINCAQAAMIDGFVSRHWPFAKVVCQDVLRRPPQEEYDLLLLLKSVPCFEQQEPGAAEALLSSVKARYLAVSFPTQSIGGRKKNMAETYEKIGSRLMGKVASDYEVWEYENEMLFFGVLKT